MPEETAVIFDMDGLLLNTEKVSVKAWTDTLTDMGYSLSPGFMNGCIGMNPRSSERYLRENLDESIDYRYVFDRAHDVMDMEIERNGIETKTGANEILAFLKECSIPFALATSTVREKALQRLSSSGLKSFFSSMVCGDEVEHGKPDPGIFLKAAYKIGAFPDCCYVLEDSDPGIIAASRAGMEPVLIPDMKPPSQDILAYTQHVFKDLIEAKEFFEGITAEVCKASQ